MRDRRRHVDKDTDAVNDSSADILISWCRWKWLIDAVDSFKVGWRGNVAALTIHIN